METQLINKILSATYVIYKCRVLFVLNITYFKCRLHIKITIRIRILKIDIEQIFSVTPAFIRKSFNFLQLLPIDNKFTQITLFIEILENPSVEVNSYFDYLQD